MKKIKKAKYISELTDRNGDTHRLIQTGSDDDEDSDDEYDTSAYKPPVLRPIDFGELAKKTTMCSTECWGCKFGFGKKPSDGNKAMELMYKTFTENKDTMGEDEFAHLIFTTHLLNVHLPARELNLESSQWSKEDIAIHIKYHMTDFKLNIQYTVRKYAFIESQLEKNIFTAVEGSDKITTDYQVLTAMLNVGTKKIDMMMKSHALSKNIS